MELSLSLCPKKKPFGHQFYNRHSLRDLGGGLGGRHGGRRQQRGNGGVCNCHRQQRPPVRHLSSGPKDGVQRNAIPSDKTVERRGRISSARETICGGDGGSIKTGEWREGGENALIISMPAGGTAEQEFKVEVCGREERNKYGRKGSERRRSRDHARNEG